jgi:anti-sigma B factor antagonist
VSLAALTDSANACCGGGAAVHVEVTLESPPGAPPYVIVTPAGDIDIDTAPAFRAALDRAVGSAPHLVIDAADVGFLDSTGIGQIAQLLGSRPCAPTQITVANARPLLRNALRVVGLDQHLQVHSFGESPGLRGVRDTTSAVA